MSYLIEFEPVGRRGNCAVGLSFLECARFLGVGLVSICGGFGKCKACKVLITRGRVSEPTAVETGFFSPAQIKQGWRLACLTFPQSDCTVHVPPESLTTLQRMQVESRDIFTAVQPAARTYPVDLPPPSFLDLRADDARLLDSLVKQHSIAVRTIDIDVLRSIALTLRDNQWQVSAVVREGEIIALNPRGARFLGLAVDVGTTKIAGYLVDLTSGQTLASKGLMNPQINFGEDITSRIHHALKSPGEASALQQAVVAALNQLVGDLCQEIGAKTAEVVDASIVGNTAMHHLLYRLPVYPLAYPPFNACVQNTLDVKARDLGLHIAPGACVHTMPNIAGFVGAYHVAMLVAIDALAINELTVAIDIGTNTEVSVIDREAIYSASCASGPAFEGGHISCGMRAASGAIERLRLENGAVQMQTIGSAQPVGICGSGIIDSVAQLYHAGVISESGRMQEGHPGVRTRDGRREFVLFASQGQGSDIVITQKDVREVQLGKGAIRAAVQVLLEAAGRREEDIRHVVIAGAFGTYIDVPNAMLLGLLPSLPLDRFQQVGNAAGLGARQALLSVEKRAREQEIAARMKYIELAGTPSFNAIFIQTQYLGHYRIVDRKRVKIG